MKNDNKMIDKLIKNSKQYTNTEINLLLKDKNKNFDKLVLSNMKMVAKIAKKFSGILNNQGVVFEDMFLEGVIGLQKAIESFDEKNHEAHAFKVYIYRAINNKIHNFSFSNKTIRVPIATAHKRYVLDENIKKLTIELRRIPTTEEIRKNNPMTDKCWNVMQQSKVAICGLDKPIERGDGEFEPLVSLVSSSSHFINDLNKNYMFTRINELIEELPSMQRVVINLYFKHNLCNRKIGIILDKTPSRIQQIHVDGLENLKLKLLKENLTNSSPLIKENPNVIYHGGEV